MNAGQSSHNRRTVDFRRIWLLPVMLCLAALLLGGCGLFGGGEDTPKAQKAKPVAKAAKPAAPAEASAAPEDDGKLTIAKLQAIQEAKAREYLFNPDGMLDPFRPIEAVLAPRPTEMTPEEMEKLTPLQKLELSQLKLVAVVVSAGGNRALVEDSSGMGYIIQVGTPMGTSNGRVTVISNDKVEVEEYFRNYLGEQKSRIAELKLKAIEGEKK